MLFIVSPVEGGAMPSIRNIQTALLNLGVFAIGLCVSVIGPTLMDLGEIYGTSTETVAHLLTSRSIGLLLGSVLGGKLFSSSNSQIVMIVSLLLTGVSVMATPVCRQIWIAHLITVVGGAAIALFEIGANVWLVRLWKEKSAPPLQMYQFFFGVGAAVAPFITEPFLSIRNVENAASESRIQIPYSIIGGSFVAVVIAMLASYCKSSENIAAKAEHPQVEDSMRKSFTTWMVFLLGAYIFFDIAIECCFSGLLATFAVHCKLHLTKSYGSYLTGAFWIAFTVGRVLAIICSYWISLSKTLIVSHIILSASAILLLMLGNTCVLCLWIGSSGLGLGLSSLYGNAVAWTVQYVELQHTHMGFVQFMTCFGTMTPPILLGSQIEEAPKTLMYWTAALVAAIGINRFIMMWCSRGRVKLASEGADRASFEEVPQSELHL